MSNATVQLELFFIIIFIWRILFSQFIICPSISILLLLTFISLCFSLKNFTMSQKQYHQIFQWIEDYFLKTFFDNQGWHSLEKTIISELNKPNRNNLFRSFPCSYYSLRRVYPLSFNRQKTNGFIKHSSRDILSFLYAKLKG